MHLIISMEDILMLNVWIIITNRIECSFFITRGNETNTFVNGNAWINSLRNAILKSISIKLS